MGGISQCLVLFVSLVLLLVSIWNNINWTYIVNMKSTSHHDEKISKMKFSSVYPHYINKVEKKGRTQEELRQVMEWLTGYDETKLNELIEKEVTFEWFFSHAKMNPNAHFIKGVICGYRVEDIENVLTRQVRYLDKLVDELARGRKMEKILRVK